MKHKSNFRATERHQSGANQKLREFSSAEELLRHDAGQTSVPPAVAERLNKSIKRDPKGKSWWRRLTGR